MAISLVFCVSCNQNSDKKSADDENSVSKTDTTICDSTQKYHGSPAFVEVMNFLDETEAQLDTCNREQFIEIHKLTYENVFAKYGKDDITTEENETLRVRYRDFVTKVVEKARDFDMGEN